MPPPFVGMSLHFLFSFPGAQVYPLLGFHTKVVVMRRKHLTEAQEKAAHLLAGTEMTNRQVSEETGINERTLYYLKAHNPDFKKLYRSLLAERTEGIKESINKDSEENLQFLLDVRDGKVKPSGLNHRVKVAMALLDRVAPATHKSEITTEKKIAPAELEMDGMDDEPEDIAERLGITVEAHDESC